MFYDFSVQNRLLKFVSLVGEFQRKEGAWFIDKLQENLVAFPHRQAEKALFGNPFKVALIAHDLFTGPVGAHKEVHILVFPDVGDESDDAAVAPLGDGEACFFAHFAEHAILGALPFFEVAANTKPFVVVQVIGFFGTVQHQVLVAAFQVTKRCFFHQ